MWLVHSIRRLAHQPAYRLAFPFFVVALLGVAIPSKLLMAAGLPGVVFVFFHAAIGMSRR